MTLLVAFSLSVALKARRGRKSIPYTQLSIISFESLTIKLESVVRYESVGHLKPSDNIPQDKLFYVLIPYICEGLCFDPFSKVICPDKEPFSATCCSRERLERDWREGLESPQADECSAHTSSTNHIFSHNPEQIFAC